MATLSRSESRRLYSWWWDSHNSPKNSKWLHDNLTDMDTKVKSMIKLIEEDADSFARRAEMYYKKRPELMKLVEEFYRAYRALAERYNHATLELRHAHRTIAKAFPDQVPLELVQDSPLKNGPHTPEIKCVARVLFDSDDEGDLEVGTRKTGNEAQCLRKALADMKGEKEEVLVKYQNCLAKLSNVQRELDNAEKDSVLLNEKASRAEIEVKTLKETLVHLDAAKIETQILKDGISRLELDKERVFIQNKEFLEKISVLENVISVMENEARILKIRAEESENEVFQLKNSLADLNEEKEKSTLQYKCCLETISKLEKDISNAKEDVKRLDNDVLVENLKFKSSEEKFNVLEMSNLSLRAEANNLAKKIAVKDRELSGKQDELENLQRNLHDERLKYAQIEATLGSLQNVHSKSRDDQRDLAMELENALRMVSALEISKNGVEQELKHVHNESRISMENMQNEIKSLKEIKERLETKVFHHVGLSDSLQREILRLKEEIETLSGSYKALIEQVEQAGLSPETLGSSMKSLQEENSKMKQKCEEQSNEKMILLKKLENVENVLVEKVFAANSLSGLNAELECSREKMKTLQESCEFLNGEKAYFVSQLQVITENMHNLLGKNAVLDNCLSTAKVELEGLKEKSKGLEKICEMLKDERSYLLNEKNRLVLKLESVERKLEILENRYTGLEEKYADLEKDKKSSDCEVEKLKLSLTVEKQEQKKHEAQNGSILVGLENQINLLKEENGCRKKEYEEELDKALKAQLEISILHKLMKEIEEKNYALVIECQKHVEASKLSEEVISELESENLEQQVEGEMLLDEIERLRLGIYKVFRAVDPDCDPVDKIENAGTFVNHIVGSVEGMKSSILKIGNDKEMLLVENSVLLTLLEEFKIVAKNEKDEILEMNERLRSNVIESNHRGVLLESELGSLRANQCALNKTCNELQNTYTMEIRSLCKVNTDLESKLEAKKDKFELFEAFCFDFEISSSIREVLYENKLHEVTSVYRDLENESASKTCEIEQMRGKICSMENEINGLKSRLHAYGPVVTGLRDDVALLEHNAVLQAKLKAARNRSQELELLEASDNLGTSPTEILPEDQSLVSLQNLHARIKDVGKMIQEANKPVSRRRSPNSKKLESITGEIEPLKAGRFLGDNNKKKARANEDTHKLHKIKTKATEVWNGMRMKDIPLDRVSNNEKISFGRDDQMLELWEMDEGAKRNRTKVSCKMTEKDIVYDGNFDPDIEKELGIDMLEVSARISEANKEVSKRRLLERLTSDAQKLENIQTTVEILKTKLETGKKGKNVNFEMVQEQLMEAEETVANLTDTNGQLVRKLRECPSPEGRVSPRRRRVLEQARKGSERIGRLQLELQKIQFILMKMEDEKKNRGGRMKFFKSKGVVLSDFIYNGKRNSSVKRKKGPLCGCLKPSSSRNIFSP